MAQYQAIKAENPEALLLFRVGDFYEAFEQDAISLHTHTNVRLTKRSNGGADSVPLAGFPYHALDHYLTQLVKAGLRVAICDQLEGAEKGKKLIKRGITEIVTPALTHHENLLKAKENNYLAAIFSEKKGPHGVAFLDLSTGQFMVGHAEANEMEKLWSSLAPKELLYSKKEKAHLPAYLLETPAMPLEGWIFQEEEARQQLINHFGIDHLDGFGIGHLTQGIRAAGAIMHYLKRSHYRQIGHITKIQRLARHHTLWMDAFTLRHLELLRPQQKEGVALIDHLDYTHTPMGGRMLRSWLLFPLIDKASIEKRLDGVGHLVEQKEVMESLALLLSKIGDMERITGKIARKRIFPRDLLRLHAFLLVIEEIKKRTKKSQNEAFDSLMAAIEPLPLLVKQIEKTIAPNPPLLLKEGGVIARNFSKELEATYRITEHGQEALAEILARERKETGISSLKMGHNRLFGYYFEVTHTHRKKVPDRWMRKQTLAQAERYTSKELSDHEERIMGAQAERIALEQRYYHALLEDLHAFLLPLQRLSQAIAHLDVHQSLAKVAITHRYCRPLLTHGPDLLIEGGRHPIIEATLPLGRSYIPNNLEMAQEKAQILLITGPNMGGKSAYLQQNALAIIMAHMGSFVAADRAQIPLTEKIFTRVGASDNIARQQSTFMVEMAEMASILHNMEYGRGYQTFMIIDEIGRGTSTLEGMALAQSILEYLHNHPTHHPLVLFATHYHALSTLSEENKRIKNFHVSVKKKENDITFLYHVVPGTTQESLGIYVAQKAGLPSSIIARAHQLRAEKNTPKKKEKDSLLPLNPPLMENGHAIIEEIKKINPLETTPMAAHAHLLAWVAAIKK